MITRFDHAVIAVRNLEDACHQFQRLGFDARPGGKHSGRGTENAIVRFGLDYIELISVYDQAEARQSGWGGMALVDFLAEHDGGLIGFCLATDGLDAHVDPLKSALPETLGPIDMQRRRPDGETLYWRLLIPGRSPWLSPYPFLIEWALPDKERLALELPGRHEIGAKAVKALTVAAPKGQLEDARAIYRELLGLPENPAGGGFGIGPFTVRLTESEPAGPTQLTIAVADIQASERFLTSRNVRVRHDPDGLRVDAAATCGAPIVLVT